MRELFPFGTGTGGSARAQVNYATGTDFVIITGPSNAGSIRYTSNGGSSWTTLNPATDLPHNTGATSVLIAVEGLPLAFEKPVAPEVPTLALALSGPLTPGSTVTLTATITGAAVTDLTSASLSVGGVAVVLSGTGLTRTGTIPEDAAVGAVIAATASATAGGQTISGSATGEVVVVPPSDIDAVVIIGASLEQGMVGRSLTIPHVEATALLADEGFSVPVYGYGFSGLGWAEAVDHYTAARAAHPNALITMHHGGNDVSDTRPFSTMTEEERDAIDAKLAAIAAAATGDTRFYHAALSFRTYGDPSVENPPGFVDPSTGSKPYNEGIVIPWVAENWPHAIGAGGRPKIDHYRHVLGQFEDILQTDGIHWTTAGNAIVLPWLMGRIATLLRGQTPAEIPERVWQPPADWLSVLNFGGSSVAVSQNIMAEDVRAGTTFPLLDVYGSETGLTVAASTVAGATSSNVSDNTGGRTTGLPGGWTRILACAAVSSRNVYAVDGYPITVCGGCAPLISGLRGGVPDRADARS